MTAQPAWILGLRAAQQRDLDKACAAAQARRKPGEVILPPGIPGEHFSFIANTPANRWACARAGVVQGWSVGPDPESGDPGVYLNPIQVADGCPSSMETCIDLGCPVKGRCLRESR